MSSERSHDGAFAYDLGRATSRHPIPETAPVKEDGPVSVVAFPTLHPDALFGLPGKIVGAIAPHTEAHPAPILLQFLARLGATVGPGPHLRIDNRAHAARLFPLVLGKTSEGAKGTSLGATVPLFAAAERHLLGQGARRGPLHAVRVGGTLNVVSGLSSGEGLIELVRDDSGDDPEAKNFVEGVDDKRLLVVEEEFAGVLSVMERQGSTLPRVIREAWDGLTLRTLTRSPLAATGAHICVIGHATPGELRIRMTDAAMLGGTMNRFIPVASRRTKLLPDGGNIPDEVIEEFAPALADAINEAAVDGEIPRSDDAQQLWRTRYPHLRRARPDGAVATILARGAPQVLRIALAYALADGSRIIDEQHMAAAFAIWRYAEDTAEWMFGTHVDTGAMDALVAFIAAGGQAGRTRTEISVDFFGKHKKKAELDALLGGLIKDGRVRQDVDRSGAGAPVTRYTT